MPASGVDSCERGGASCVVRVRAIYIPKRVTRRMDAPNATFRQLCKARWELARGDAVAKRVNRMRLRREPSVRYAPDSACAYCAAPFAETALLTLCKHKKGEANGWSRR